MPDLIRHPERIEFIRQSALADFRRNDGKENFSTFYDVINFNLRVLRGLNFSCCEEFVELNTIYPVILAVPDNKRNLSGKNRTLYLSRHARYALEISAQKSCIHLSNLLKDENGVPMPCGGNYWSLSHKPAYVAAVVASERIGIDIEEIRTCSESLFRKIADYREWGLTDTDKFKLFFRYWTAKEAVLKAVGTGLKDLSKCKIAQVVDENNLAIDYMNKRWLIEHLFFNGHVASVNKGLYDINWSVD